MTNPHNGDAERPLVSDALTLAATEHAPGRARELVTQRLADWDRKEAVEVAELVISELATNAVQQTADESQVIRIYLALMSKAVIVGVIDHAPGWPQLLEADSESERHRGLQLVEALCVRWVCEQLKPTARGKMVWAEISLGVDPLQD